MTRPQWPPEKEVTEVAVVKTRTKELLNNQNNSIRVEENREEKERLDKEFQEDNNYENYVNYFKSKGILFPRSMWTSVKQGEEVPVQDTKTSGCEQNLTKGRNPQRMVLKLDLEELVLRRGQEEHVPVVGGVGEVLDCEYDSERGKFNCNVVEEEVAVASVKQPPTPVKELGNFNANNEKGVTLMVNKKIEYFENKLKPSKEDNRLKEAAGKAKDFEVKRVGLSGHEKDMGKPIEGEEKTEEERKLINILCLGSFFMTALLLYLFPLPN